MAVRIAQMDGIHTQLPGDELGDETVNRCRNLWGTLCIMDQYCTSSLGLTPSTADCDILAQAPSLQQDTILSLQTKLSQLLAVILTSRPPQHLLVKVLYADTFKL